MRISSHHLHQLTGFISLPASTTQMACHLPHLLISLSSPLISITASRSQSPLFTSIITNCSSTGRLPHQSSPLSFLSPPLTSISTSHLHSSFSHLRSPPSPPVVSSHLHLPPLPSVTPPVIYIHLPLTSSHLHPLHPFPFTSTHLLRFPHHQSLFQLLLSHLYLH